MSTFIVHHEGYFFDWSTVVDAPTSHAMTRDEYEAHYRLEYGKDGMRTLPDRLSRAIENGTSCIEKTSARELIACNRAGPREGELSFKKVMELVHSARRRHRRMTSSASH